MVIQRDSAWHLYLQYKVISWLFSGHLFKAPLYGSWGDLERKDLETANKGNCHKTHAKSVFCPVIHHVLYIHQVSKIGFHHNRAI